MVILFWLYYKTEKRIGGRREKNSKKKIFLFYSTHKNLENKK